MIQSYIDVRTRGIWRSRELKYATLAVLRQHSREVEAGIAFPHFLTAKKIIELTGGNPTSIRTLLKKWCRGRVIERQKYGKLFGYSITARGHTCFEMLTEGYLSRRRGRFIQIDARAVLRRLPAYRGEYPRGQGG